MIHFDDSYHLFSAYDALADDALGVQLVYMTAVANIVEGSAMHQTQCKDELRHKRLFIEQVSNLAQ